MLRLLPDNWGKPTLGLRVFTVRYTKTHRLLISPFARRFAEKVVWFSRGSVRTKWRLGKVFSHVYTLTILPVVNQVDKKLSMTVY